MVCAQRSTVYRRNDVADNLNQLIISLIEFKEGRRLGMFTITGGTASDLVRLVGTYKRSDSAVQIFSSVTPPILQGNDFGASGFSLPEIHRRPDMFYPLINRRANCVASFEPRMGDDPELYRVLLRALVASPMSMRGVNLVTYGSFTAHEHVQRVFEREARDRGIIVFASNSVPGGTDDHNYAAGVSFAKNGFHAVQMSTSALLAKANLANAVYADTEGFLRFINDVNYCGEFRSEYWDARIKTASSGAKPLLTGSPPEFNDFVEIEPGGTSKART